MNKKITLKTRDNTYSINIEPDSIVKNLNHITNINNIQAKKSDDLFEYVSVKHRMYEPVKRENKIKVVSTKLNIKASGF